MSKSPLKHKQGDAQAHAPYASEDLYHSSRANKDVPKNKAPETNVLQPSAALVKDFEKFNEEFTKKKTEEADKAKKYLEENNVKITDYDVNNGVLVNKKDGKMLHPEDDPETWDAIHMDIIGDRSIVDTKKKQDALYPNSNEIAEMNTEIDNVYKKINQNRVFLSQPQNYAAIQDNTRYHAPVTILDENFKVTPESDSKDFQDYDDLPGEKSYLELLQNAKQAVAKNKGVGFFEVQDDDPDVKKAFKETALTQWAAATQDNKIKLAADKESSEKYGKFYQSIKEKEGDRKENVLKELHLESKQKQEGVFSYVDKRTLDDENPKLVTVKSEEYQIVESQLDDAYSALVNFRNPEGEASKNVTALNKRANALLSLKPKTQEEVDAANKELDQIRVQLNKYKNAEQGLYNTYSQAYNTFDRQHKKALLLNETTEDFKKYSDLIAKDIGIFSKGQRALAANTGFLLANLENSLAKSTGSYFGLAKNNEFEEGRKRLQGFLRDGGEYILSQTDKNTSLNSWEQAGEYAVNLAGTAAPVIASIYLMRGNPKTGMALMYGMSSGQKYYDQDENNWVKEIGEDKYGKYAGLMYHVIPFLSGTATAVSERFTLGLAGRSSLMRKSINGNGLYYNGARKALKEQLKYKSLKTGAFNIAGEAITEYNDLIAQQVISKYLGGDDSVVVGEGGLSALVDGGLIAGMFFNAPGVAMNTLNGFRSKRSQKGIDADLARMEEVSGLLNNDKLSETQRTELVDEMGNLTTKINNIVGRDIQNVDLFSDKEKETLVNIQVEQTKLRSQLKDIQLNSKLRPDQQKKEAERLKDKYSKLEAEKQFLTDVYTKAYYTQQAEGDNIETIKKFSKKIFGDNMQVEVANSEVEAMEMMELNMRERKVAIIENHIRLNGKNAPLSAKDKKDIASINFSLKNFRNIYETKELASEEQYGALTSNGFITPPDVDGRQQIIINSKKALEDGFVTTAQHEFLHAVLLETMKNDAAVQTVVGEALMNYVNDIAEGPLGDSELVQRMLQYKDNEGVYNEEFITLLSEAMVRENLPFKKEAFQGIKDTFRRLYQNYHKKNIEFNTGKDVYNFLRDYNHSIKRGKLGNAIVNMARKGATGALVEDAISQTGPIKQSKAASDKVQSIYEEQGVSGAMDIIEQFAPIVNKIVQRRSEAPGFDRELLTSEINIGERGIFDLIQSYNPESGVPLAAYINKFLPARAIEASKRVLGEEFTDDISERVDVEGDAGIPTFEESNRPKIAKTVLGERLGVSEQLTENARAIIANLDIDKVNFKNTPNIAQDITANLFGISSNKISNNANLTKGEVREAQQFIVKNADLLMNMLPEGATAGGTSTGVQNVLLKEFYTKTERAKMAKTGTKAGLPVQIKNKINKKQFTEFFGIRPAGTPNVADRNTSAKILALAKQTNRMMSNQAIRLELQNQGAPVKALQIIADGKSDYMFSRRVAKQSVEDKKALYDALPNLYDTYIKHDRSMESTFNALLPEDTFGKDRKKIIEDFEGYVSMYEKAKANYDAVQAPIIPIAEYINKELTESVMAENMKKLIGLGKGSIDFRNTEQLQSVRSAVVNIAHKIGWEKAERFLPFLYASGKIGGTKLTSLYDGSGNLIEDAEFDNKLIEKGKRKEAKDEESIRYGLYRGVNDFKESVLVGLKGWNNDNTNFIPVDAKQSVNVDVSSPALAKVNRDSANRNKKFLIELMDVSRGLIAEGKMTKNDLGMIMMSLAGDMRTPLAAAAHVSHTTGGPISTKTHRYEHMIPRKVIGLYLADYAIGNTSKQQVEGLLDQFSVAILDKVSDDIVGKYNKDSMPAGWIAGDNVLQRYFNTSTFGEINTRLIDVLTGKPEPLSNAFADAADVLIANAKENFKFSKAVNNGRNINENTESRGMSAFDFDETLIDKGENTIIATKGNDVVKISSGNWPLQGPQLAQQGYNFDFSDFVNVKGGVEGPLMQKFRNRIAKYGIKNNYILTARPQEAAPAIQAWLKTQGINMPIENITGLGNSTGEAKAMWIAEKYSEGYNDIYFVDDALPNVEAVKNMMDQLDIKGSSVQAKIKFSKGLSSDFNKILEETANMPAEKVFSSAKARKRGAKKGRFKIFIPPSHEDLTGLYYHFLTKGKKGEQQMKWFEKALIKPLNRAYTELNAAKQSIATDYKALKKQYPDVRKQLIQKTPDGDFTYGDAVRTYLWDKHGYDIPGLSKTDQNNLVGYINANPDMTAFAEALDIISKQESYVPPGEYWLSEDIRNDLEKATGRVGREQYFQEFIENSETVFSPENMNKIEAVYGSNFREALEDILYRTKTGTNRNFGKNRIVNQFMDFLNGSIGATMFFNARSAVLQTLSTVNFINWSDNNPFKAAAAFANQKQYWKDFSFIFNSDTLKQRRGGLQNDINANELANYLDRSKNPARAAISYLLTKGFLPTQIADSFAISSGGATFYRNRIKTYLKEGLTQQEAEQRAWTDFSEVSEATQQSARPDMISQQQASVLGRMILAFQNTPSQYARLIKKAGLDLINGRGDAKTHISKIIYYGAVQNLIFYSLQSALFGIMFGDDDDEDDEFFTQRKDRIANSMIDGILRGSGVGGAVVSTIKNMAIKYAEESGKKWGKDTSPLLVEALNVSPPIGIKARKLVSAQKTMNYNREVIEKMKTFDVDNPVWSAVGNTTEALTNVPLARLHNKVMNVREAANSENEAWQRVALMLGWNRWDVQIPRSEKVEAVRQEIKDEKAAARKEKQKIKKAEKKIEEKKKEAVIEEKNKEIQKKEKKEGKEVTCAAVNKSGKRCSNKVVDGGNYCTVHQKVEQRKDGKKTQCSHVKSNGKRCKMQTSATSGKCYYHD